MSMYLTVLIIALIFSIVLILFFFIRALLIPKKASNIRKNIADGKYTKAIKNAKHIIAKNPKDNHTRYLLGKAYIAIKSPENALSEFKIINKTATFTSSAEETEFRTTLAQLCVHFNQLEDALNEYGLLSALEPSNANHYFAIGELYEKLNNSDKAYGYFRKTLELNPKHVEAHVASGLILLRNKKLPDAKKEIEMALQLDPNNREALFYEGIIFKEAKEYSLALNFFEKAAVSQKLRQKCYIERGICFMEAKMLNKAKLEFEKAIQTTSKKENKELLYARYLLAACHEKEKDFDKAIKQWESITAITPKFKDVASKLAQHKGEKIDDYMKEYLSLETNEFYSLCKAITEQHLHLKIQSKQATKQGYSIIAIEDNTEQWRNVRKQPKLILFLRLYDSIQESFLISIYEQMKSKSITRSIIFTSSDFSPSAIQYAENRPIELIDKQKLEHIMSKIQIP